MIEAVDVQRTKLLTVRMSDEEYDRMERLARRQGISASDLVRRLLMREDERTSTELGQVEMHDRCVRHFLRADRRLGNDHPPNASAAASGYDANGVYVLRGHGGQILERYTYDAANDRVRVVVETPAPKKKPKQH